MKRALQRLTVPGILIPAMLGPQKETDLDFRICLPYAVKKLQQAGVSINPRNTYVSKIHLKKRVPELNGDNTRLLGIKDHDTAVDKLVTKVQRRLGIADSPGKTCGAHHQLSKVYGLPVLIIVRRNMTDQR